MPARSPARPPTISFDGVKVLGVEVLGVEVLGVRDGSS